MKRVAVYMRVSTANQEEEETIENQKMELLERIKADGHTITPDCIYQDEGWSGSIIQRPDLDRLRADAHDKKFDLLYYYDRGRLSRIFYHQEIVLNELQELGIAHIGLHEINGVSHEERLMGSVMGIFQEYERLKIAERMRIGKLRKVRENKKLLGYQPKYGYDYLPRIKKGENARDGKFIINEKQAEVVRMIFEWCVDGKSKYAIQKELYERDIMPPKAKRKAWSTGVIDRLLRDSTYMGEHYYNKSESVPTRTHRKAQQYRKTVKGSRVARPKDDWLMVKVDAIVSKELFDNAQAQLVRNKRTYDRKNKTHNYLVGGIIECPCGFKRTGDSANNSLYYRCNDRLNNRLGIRECFEHPVSAPVLDDLVWNNIKQLLTHPELIFEQAKKWRENASPLELRYEQLNAQLPELDDKEMRFAKMYGEGVMSEYVYKENVAELNAKRTHIVSELSGIRDQIANTPTLPLEELVQGVVKLVTDLDYSKRRQIIQKLVSKVVATKQEVTVWGYVPVLAQKENYTGYVEDDTQNQTQSKIISNLSEIGLNVKYRNRRPPERGKIYPVQRADEQRYFSRELSVRNNRTKHRNCSRSR